MPYDKIVFNNQGPPGISAERLAYMQTQYDEAAADLATHAAITDTLAHPEVLRTPDQSQAPASGSGTLSQLLSWLTNRFKAITGKPNWWDVPDTSLTAAKTHIDATAPHSGHALASDIVAAAAANKVLRLNVDSKLPASITGDAVTLGGKIVATIESEARTNNTELRTEVLAAAPAGPAQGRVYFDSSLGRFKGWTGSAWL